MNKRSYKIILAVSALTLFGALPAAAQSKQPHRAVEAKASVQAGKKAPAQTNQAPAETEGSAMLDEPHYVLAEAYKQNVAAFARALRDQAQRGAVSSDFARAMVAEISRSIDHSVDHRKDHMKTMSADARLKMAGMMKEMELRSSRLKDACKVLEKDVGEYTLNSKQIAMDSAEIVRQVDDMPRTRQPE